ncbi:DUF475 domain-containing protein [Massilia oculi]|uniref:DUF475 domain-containing protein n=1 Tax=Massilia hydrophila TaxID=3044279 RepID=A0ABS7Y7D0_9BURK|nr:DUF475 domain-containing protein [Massilia oculi]MCA1855595.1 DUF475 domain-containing protein [Massilia oculi]
MKHFIMSFLVTALCLALAGAWGYRHGGSAALFSAVGLALMLGIMEVSLSFDNAVVNASVLKGWNLFWQRLFLGLGILVAVFGMRLLFPLVIAAATADLGIGDVWTMALREPDRYAAHLTSHHAQVAVFGGVFLLLVFLNFLFDEDKEVHWLGHVERKLGSFGRIAALPVLLSLGAVLACASLAGGQKLAVLSAGVWGVLTYVGVDALGSLLEKEEESRADAGRIVKQGGIGGFIYLEVLDASFSFDGVIGAFAMTKDVVIIMLGLAIGAMFVRSLTVYLVRQGTLEEFVFLEHGAHYAIGALALIMLASLKYHVPEIVTGLTGVAFILASLWASVLHKRNSESHGGKLAI